MRQLRYAQDCDSFTTADGKHYCVECIESGSAPPEVLAAAPRMAGESLVSSHPCPGPGCGYPVPADKLACYHHWFQISQPLRDEVEASWKALQADPGVGGDPIEAEHRHDLAMAAAIAEMRPWP